MPLHLLFLASTRNLSRSLLLRNGGPFYAISRNETASCGYCHDAHLYSFSIFILVHRNGRLKIKRIRENGRKGEKVSFLLGGAGDKYRFHLDPIAIERKQTPARTAVGLGFGPTTDYSALCLSSFLFRFFADFRASLLRATVFLRLELTLVLCGSFYDGKI